MTSEEYSEEQKRWIPAFAGMTSQGEAKQELDSRLRGNDEQERAR